VKMDDEIHNNVVQLPLRKAFAVQDEMPQEMADLLRRISQADNVETMQTERRGG